MLGFKSIHISKRGPWWFVIHSGNSSSNVWGQYDDRDGSNDSDDHDNEYDDDALHRVLWTP